MVFLFLQAVIEKVMISKNAASGRELEKIK